MTNSFEFDAEVRYSTGTASARALRRENKVPAIIYGGEGQPQLITLDHNKLIKNLDNEAFYSHVLNIHVDGKEEKTVIKALHRHPCKPTIVHVDFQRVSKDHKIRVQVPLHFVGEDVSVGVKKGGVVTHNFVQVEVLCLPGDLPEFIEVDASGIDLGKSLYLSELKMPPGVEVVALAHGEERDVPVVAVQLPRAEQEPEPEQDETSEDTGEQAPE